MSNFTLNPVGHVDVGQSGFTIKVDKPYRDALRGLEGFSHLNILFWCHLLDEPLYREMVTTEKPYKNGPDQVGIFATRSPARPNPIATTPVGVNSLDVDEGLVHITYIDAEPGTPVLDIKPYVPAIDRVRDTASPDWCSDWPEWYEDSATFDWGAVFENAQ